jgi:hypothetical protein
VRSGRGREVNRGRRSEPIPLPTRWNDCLREDCLNGVIGEEKHVEQKDILTKVIENARKDVYDNRYVLETTRELVISILEALIQCIQKYAVYFYHDYNTLQYLLIQYRDP